MFSSLNLNMSYFILLFRIQYANFISISLGQHIFSKVCHKNVTKYIIISLLEFYISSSIAELKHSLRRKRNKTCWETEECSDYDRVAEGREIPAQCEKAHRVGGDEGGEGGRVPSICCGFCCSGTCRESRHVSYACEHRRLPRGTRAARAKGQGQGRRTFDKFGKIAAATDAAEEREGKVRRWLKWSWRWLRKIFGKAAKILFIKKTKTRAKKMFTVTTSRQLPPLQQTNPLPPHTHTALALPSSCAVYQLPRPLLLAFWVWLIFAVLMYNFNICTKHVCTCSCTPQHENLFVIAT